MVAEDHEMPRGWPFGLGNLNMRLQVIESSQPGAAEQYSLRAHSSGFSSFSSSNFDTEINQSTASFFQDHSTSLGRLIGIAPRERRAVYNIPNTNTFEQHENLSERRACLDVHKGHGEEMARGICVPLLVSILVKVSRSKSNSRK